MNRVAKTGIAIGAASLAAALAVIRTRNREPALPLAPYDSAPTRILILGGGFGGLNVARSLAKRLARCEQAAIRLVDRSESMTFWPMVPEVMPGSIQAPHVVRPLREELSRAGVEYIHAEVLGADCTRRVVHTMAGDMTYDKLVIALGWQTAFFGTQGADAYAVTLESLADAVAIRARVIKEFEAAAAGRPHNLRFVVVGGGSTGVEVAASLADLVDILLGEYPGVAEDEVRIVVVQAQNDVLPHMEQGLRDVAAQRLRKDRIELRLHARVQTVDAGGVQLSDGVRISGATVIWTAGVEANRVARKLSGVPLDSHGRVLVDHQLRVSGLRGVYALGDVAAATSDGRPVSPTAQAAVQEAETVAANIAAEVAGGASLEFRYHDLGRLVELGGRFAVSEVSGVRLSGWT
ncbi:MAG TPA: FAD-dependent oxidoreductase, partial [Candidatus Dormibacteraeota bacterium]|nr:FAD-dependent oxidoreductase [Candidatus Dormibacteraeota bacterium]